MKKTWLIAGLLAASAIFAQPAAAQQPTIPVIVKDTTSFYWQIVLAGARKAGQDLGVKVPELGAQSEADINGQIAILENAVASKPAAIGIDSAADSKAFTSFLTTDNVQGGRIAADGLAAAITAKYGKAEGEVALVTHLPGVGSLDERAKGFKEQLAAKYPGIKLVADKVSDGTANGGLNITTDLLTAFPNLRGIFASNLIQAQGAIQAIAESKAQDKVKLVGFDSDDKLVKAIKDGVMAATVVQDPFRMGYDGVKTALAASKGEKVEAFVDTGANLITQANMNEPRAQELLNPKVK